MTKSRVVKKMMNNGIALETIWRLLPNKRRVLSFGVTTRFLRLLIPLVFGVLVNRMAAFGNGHGDIRMIIAAVALLLSSEILGVLLGVGEEKSSISSFAAFSCLLKGRVWASACKLPQLEYDRVSIGEWERKISYDVETMTDAVRIFLGTMLNLSVTFLGTILIILFKQPLFVIPLLIVLALNVLSHFVFKRRIARVSNLMRKQFYREGAVIYGCIEMQPLLRAFSLLDTFTRFFTRCINRTRIAVVHNWRVMADFRLLLQSEFWMVKAIVLIGCMWAFCRGALSMGAVVSFTMLINQLIDGVSELMSSLPQLDIGYESSKALKNVMDKANSECGIITISSAPPRLYDADAVVVFDDVTFHYPGMTRNVVEKFSARIHRNEFVCFLGRNGAGKSTLAKMLLGQYEPVSGYVLRKQSNQAWVSQRIMTFEGSILENVRLMDNNVSREDVMTAVELCGLAEFVNGLERGIDTRIKTDEMSGGELQALGIARALVRKPDLIVADELTNNLDVVARQRISSILATLREKCTIIFITHDIDVMNLADRTFAFRDGAIEEVSKKEDALKFVCAMGECPAL